MADAIEKRVQLAASRTEGLTQAVLAKAFSGELVPTEAELARAEGRTYETAEALLARIRLENETRRDKGIPAQRHAASRKRRRVAPRV